MKCVWAMMFCVAAINITACHKSNNPGNNNELQLVFADSVYQLTGVAISKEGRLFTNYPLWSDIYKYAVVEIQAGNSVRPYPDSYMNSWHFGLPGNDKWVCVQAVYIDDNNNLWIVDPAAPKMEQVYQNSHKLVKFNVSTNAVEKVYRFEEAAGSQSYINDVRVDTKKNFAYLTNSKEGGILVVNLTTGTIKQVLQQHYSVKSDPAYHFTVDGHELTKNGQPVKINSDGIALTPEGEWLYYKPLTDDKLYRIQTSWLQTDSLNEQQLEAKVQDLGHFNTTDGMIFDKKGNLYMGDIEHYAIVQITPDLKKRTILQDDRLIWPDSYSISDDGYLYISCSQIQKQPDYNNGANLRTTPYAIYRLQLPR
jgi:sugar lactone lactonase YvrE